MQFLIVTGNFVRTGGMDRPNYALAVHLADTGHEVHLVAYSASDDLTRRPNVRFHKVSKPVDSYLISDFLLARTARHWARRVSNAGGRVIVNGGNCIWPDVNWVHYVHAAYRPRTSGGSVAAARARVSHAVSLVRERAALRRAKLVLVNSERTRRDVVDKVRVPDNRVRVVYYGIDATTFTRSTPAERCQVRRELDWPIENYTAAFVGGLGDRRKGFDVAFEAWSRLCRDPAWDVDLAVIGTGAELPYWQERVARGSLDSRVRLLGFRKDVPNILRACDLLIAPTRYEAYGLGVQEALCSGLPAFVSAESGVGERYPESLRDFLLPNPEDADDLVLRLRCWRAGPDQFRDAIAPFADQLARRSWQSMAADICSDICESTDLGN